MKCVVDRDRIGQVGGDELVDRPVAWLDVQGDYLLGVRGSQSVDERGAYSCCRAGDDDSLVLVVDDWWRRAIP